MSTANSRSKTLLASTTASRPVKVSEIETTTEQRITMPSGELNRVLGGGLVAGSIILIGGEPGIGKSTLVLQNILSIKSRTVLYVSGEESASQLRMRADRLGRLSDTCYIVCETSLDAIFRHIESVNRDYLSLTQYRLLLPTTSSRQPAA